MAPYPQKKYKNEKKAAIFTTSLSPSISRMMSAAQSQSALESKLESLQCHFTWDLDSSRSKLFRLRDNLTDIGIEEGYSWLGHIYNLQGFIHHQLSFVDDALRFLSMSAEAFRQMRNTVSDEGPWLVVNYGNLAWLHHLLGERAESQAYLTKIDILKNEYPARSHDELHPEICAEKAWTLMKFSADKKRTAADYFQRAIMMQPDMVEWQTSHVLVLVDTFEHGKQNQEAELLEKMRVAKEQDPENLYLAALYLEACAQKGAKIEDQARELARRVLRKPVSSYSGIDPILRLYRMYVSMDEAIDLAEEALERHQNERYLTRCAAICYKMKIFSQGDNPLEHSMIERAISLYKEVISRYPDSSLKMQITLANIYAKSNQQFKGDQIMEELLQRDLDTEEKQMLYNRHARYLFFSERKSQSIEYHMKAAAMPEQSFYHQDSIRQLEKIRERNRSVEDFLFNLQH